MHKLIITPSGVTSRLTEDLDEVDIESLLKFNEAEIEELLRTHASTQAYWEALAIRYKKRYTMYKDTEYRKWWAYHRKYAKLVLSAYGESAPTKETIKDQVVSIYTEDTTDAERKKFSAVAYTVVSRRKDEINTADEFFCGMFKYILGGELWYFETIERTLSQLREDADLVESVADKLNSRSFHMQSLLQLLSAKNFNMGPKSLPDRDLAKQINGG